MVEIGLRESENTKEKKVIKFIKNVEKKMRNNPYKMCIAVDNMSRVIDNCERVRGHELILVDDDEIRFGHAIIIGYVEMDGFDEIHWMDESMDYVSEEYIINEILQYLNSEYEEIVIEMNRLKRRREKNKLTQAKLSEMSGVSLKSIQAYEQGTKDINKAQGMTLYKLSKVLGCKIEDFLDI